MTRAAQRRSALARCSRMAKMVRISNIEKEAAIRQRIEHICFVPSADFGARG